MKLLIDDERVLLPNHQPPDIIATNLQAGMLVLIGLEKVGELEATDLYLDHDLGEENVLMTGRKIMEHLKQVNHHITGLKPHKIVCVSSNPYGRQIIEDDVRILYGRTFR